METAQLTKSASVNAALTIAAAAGAGVLGCYGFAWLLGQGFYALALPGILAGLAAGMVTRQRSVPVAVVCGVIALVAGLLSEWHWCPFIADDSLGYFLTHLQDLRPMTMILLLLGAGCGFYFALGRNRFGPAHGAGE